MARLQKAMECVQHIVAVSLTGKDLELQIYLCSFASLLSHVLSTISSTSTRKIINFHTSSSHIRLKLGAYRTLFDFLGMKNSIPKRHSNRGKNLIIKDEAERRLETLIFLAAPDGL